MTNSTAVKKTNNPQSQLEFGSISKTTLRDQTYGSLKQAILSGKIQQGKKINIRELVAISDFSSTPIREGLLKLEHEGLVVRDGGGHFFVRQLSREEVEHVLQMRVLLETYGAARAVKKVTEQDIAWLEDNVRGAETALAQGRLDGITLLNFQFHRYIAGIAGNEVLNDLIRSISDKMWISTSNALWVSGEPETAVRGHKEILFALKEKDAKKLKKALTHHILLALRWVLTEESGN